MKISPSEKFVMKFFKSRYNVGLEKIDEYDGKDGCSADFEYKRDGQRLFVCELKELLDVPLSVENGFEVVEHPSGVVEASKKHNATNRISSVIKDGHKQLSKYREPKILTILNFSRFLGFDDLVETFNGYYLMANEDGETFIDTYAKRASEGRIKNIKKEIDLYIWIDSSRKSPLETKDLIFFKCVSEVGKKIESEVFGKPSMVA